MRDKKAVLILDRGAMDGKLFCTDVEWRQVLKDTAFTDQDLLNRYDLCVHLTSCAAGLDTSTHDRKFIETHYEYGVGSNNPSRYHTPEQACESDERSREVYGQHPHYFEVRNKPKFSDKIKEIMSIVSQVSKMIVFEHAFIAQCT